MSDVAEVPGWSAVTGAAREQSTESSPGFSCFLSSSFYLCQRTAVWAGESETSKSEENIYDQGPEVPDTGTQVSTAKQTRKSLWGPGSFRSPKQLVALQSSRYFSLWKTQSHCFKDHSIRLKVRLKNKNKNQAFPFRCFWEKNVSHSWIGGFQGAAGRVSCTHSPAPITRPAPQEQLPAFATSCISQICSIVMNWLDKLTFTEKGFDWLHGLESHRVVGLWLWASGKSSIFDRSTWLSQREQNNRSDLGTQSPQGMPLVT